MVFSVRTVGCLSSMLLLAGASMARAQSGPNGTYADFSGLASATPVQLRLTYIAALQDEVHPPLTLVVTGQKAAPLKFQQQRRMNRIREIEQDIGSAKTLNQLAFGNSDTLKRIKVMRVRGRILVKQAIPPR